MSFKDSELVVYKFYVINQFDVPLFEIHLKQTFLPLGGKNHSFSGSSLWHVSQDALPLKLSCSWLFIHFSMLPIMPLFNLWSSIWNRKSPKGNPTEPWASCWNCICTPRIMWVNISYHKLPTEQFNPKLAWRFLSLETFKGGGSEEVALQGTKREPPTPPLQWHTFSWASGNLMQIQPSAQMQRIIAH